MFLTALLSCEVATMIKLNEHLASLPGAYLFAEVAKRSKIYSDANPGKDLIKLGIGDVSLPLPSSSVSAMQKAAEEMGIKESFRGYGPYEGYDFLREAISINEYISRGTKISADEIFISDGAKSDVANIGELFATDCRVAVCDPVYPVYVDVSAMSGRSGNFINGIWSRIIYMPCVPENNFVPQLPQEQADLIYLCYPNNPTGVAAGFDELKIWVDYANEHDSVIIYDSAYRAYISDKNLPHSIFEIPGAETCAIEIGSFSKTAGFTGTRCSFIVIPKRLKRGGKSLYDLWYRRQSSKYNGCSYIIQRGAEAIYSDKGKAEVSQLISYYMSNAKFISDSLKEAGLEVYGGINSPYIWFKTIGGMSSWDFFDFILANANVVTTPGSGFGPSGEGFIRLTAFGDAEQSRIAVSRISEIL